MGRVSDLVLMASLLKVMAGCGQDSGGPADLQAEVSTGQKQRAFDIVSSADYIPWQYNKDGCYARALFMSMELAAEEIPSSALYLFGDLQPDPSTIWTFHVAPLVTDSDAGSAVVLDPSLASHPLTVAEWVSRADREPDESYEYYLTEGSVYYHQAFGEIRPFSEERSLLADGHEDFAMVEGFEPLGEFRLADICYACHTLCGYLPEAGPGCAERQKRLRDRTRWMLPRLGRFGKLDERWKAPLFNIKSCYDVFRHHSF